MKHREIWHEIHIDAAPHQVYLAVTNPEKIAHWWTTDARGKSAIGEKMEFWFSGQLAAEVDVAALDKDVLVQWQVTERSIPDWINTEISFNLIPKGRQTVLHLRHSKWLSDAKTFPECSMHWAIFLLSLKEYVETGKGRPHPYDMPVNIPSE